MHDKKLASIPIFKLILIVGVVIIHCNILNVVPSEPGNYGLSISELIVLFTRVCVPSFFIISGYLFFNNVDKFTPSVYRSKLISRVRTLLVPYVLWNLFCVLLFLVKVKYLHFNGLGIIEGDKIYWGRFLEGFVFIPEAYGMPYAFAFWFIRNLMAFVVLTPLVWVMARRWVVFGLFVIFITIFEVSTFGIEWFVLGAAFGIHKIPLNAFNKKWVLAVSGILYASTTVLRFPDILPDNVLSALVFDLQVLSGFCFLYDVSCLWVRFSRNNLMKLLCEATFFIYAFHQCYVTVNLKFWCHLYGCHTSITTLLAFFSAILALLLTSVAVYIVLRELCPRLLTVITGGR